jgi:hypothetical protein
MNSAKMADMEGRGGQKRCLGNAANRLQHAHIFLTLSEAG